MEDKQINLETTRFFTPMGIRFWDMVTNKQVSDNLVVTARPDKMDFPFISAFRTPSGIYAFQGLPGLHEVEHPIQDIDPDKHNKKHFIIKVEDQMRRFLPVVFSLDLPIKGIFPDDVKSISLQNKASGFYLISAPTRSISPGIAAIRGQLIEKSTNKPAAYAVIEVVVDGKNWFGVANEQGSISILFPYPDFKNTSLSSSSLHEQQWDLTIQVRYDPKTLSFPNDSRIPKLHTIFEQPTGIIWSSTEPKSDTLELNVTCGHEFTLRTKDYDKSQLLIDINRITVLN
jgi:hypothetical protein